MKTSKVMKRAGAIAVAAFAVMFSAKVEAAVAEIGETQYDTLQAAINAAEAGATVKLIANISGTVTVSKKLTIDLNGKTITSAGSTVVVNGANADLTVKDTSEGASGAIITTGTGDEGVAVKNNATFTLESGKVQGVKNGIYVYSSGGNAFVTGGTVESTYWTVDKWNSFAIAVGNGYAEVSGGNLIGGTYIVYKWAGTVKLTGGTYSMFSEDVQGPYIADGYISEKNEDGTYSIVKGSAAFIGETGYSTLAAALEAVKSGETVTINEAGTYVWNMTRVLPADVTVEATVDGVTVEHYQQTKIMAESTLTVKNIDFSAGNYGVLVENTSADELTFIGCSFTTTANHYSFYASGELNDVKFVFNDCVFNGFVSFGKSASAVTVTGGTINDDFVVRQDAVFTGTSVAEDAQIQVGQDSETISGVRLTLTACTVADADGNGETPAVKDVVSTTNVADGDGNVVIIDGERVYGTYPPLSIKMVDGAPRIGSKARSVTLEASVDLENVQWNEITATAVDSAADADGIYWFIPAPKTGDANVYRFFKIAE